MGETEVENIKQALQKGLNLYICRSRVGLVTTSLITPFENWPYQTITSTEMPTDEEALLWLDQAHKNRKGVLLNSDSRPLREKISSRHRWLMQDDCIVGKYQEGQFNFHAVRKWDNKVVEVSQGKFFVPAYYALDEAITDLSFNRAQNPQYMFGEWEPRIHCLP